MRNARRSTVRPEAALASLSARPPGTGTLTPMAKTETAPRALSKKQADREIERLQTELVRLQDWIVHAGLKVVVVFEGRDTAGKGGVIKRITEKTSPRVIRTVALGTPTERERTQWYFQRYVAHLPAAGEMVLFDRSWYNRAGVERVMGFCTDEEYQEFMRSAPRFERMIQQSGLILIKYWLSVSDEEQERRFKARINDPTKQWKLSPMDLEARARWVDYAEAKDEMFAYTDTKESPWYVVEADSKREARLNLISHLLDQIPCRGRPAGEDQAAAAPGTRLRAPARGEPDLRAAALRDRVSGRRKTGRVAVCGTHAPQAGQLPPPGTRSALQSRVSHSLQVQVNISPLPADAVWKRISALPRTPRSGAWARAPPGRASSAARRRASAHRGERRPRSSGRRRRCSRS